MTDKILGIPKQTPEIWVRLDGKGQLKGAGDKPVSPEQKELAGYEMKSSISRKGDCWDNALTERFWGRLKVGRLNGRKFETRRQAMDYVIDWIMFYNHRRIHSTLVYVSAMQFQKNWHVALQKKAAKLNG